MNLPCSQIATAREWLEVMDCESAGDSAYGVFSDILEE
jgi:hypothetical protein